MSNELLKRFISSIILLPLVFFSIIKGSYFFYLILLLIFLISSYEWNLISKNKFYRYYGYIFLIFSIYCVYKLRFDFGNSFWPFLIVTITCILTDIGGYIFGKLFKGPKITKISPNKTYAGMIGSFILSICFVPFIFKLNLINEKGILSIIFLIIIISSVSQIGDLILSYFKRKAKVKNTGKILPGHGGLLDRIDGMLFAFPIAYIFKLTIF